MLKMIRDEEGAYTVVMCDHCGARIDDAESGNYEWAIDRQRGTPTTGEIVFTHKHCTRAFRAAHGGDSAWQCSELTYFPLRLGNSLGIRWPDAIQSVKYLSELE